MTRIADLLDRDFSRAIEKSIKVTNHDPAAVVAELTEYVATDSVEAAYERLFAGMAAAHESGSEGGGVWISGLPGAGKSSFVKNLGYVLANREICGSPVRSIFLERMESRRVIEYVEYLNQSVPYEVFMCDVEEDESARTDLEQIAAVLYRRLLRDLDFAEDYALSELEFELEKEGKLPSFQRLCRAQYKVDWREVREGNERVICASALLHQLNPRIYASTDAWVAKVTARPLSSPGIEELVEKSFDLCESRCHAKAFAFILDGVDEYLARGHIAFESLCALAGQFGRQSHERVKAGRIRGPVWLVVTARQTLEEVHRRFAGGRNGLPKLERYFARQIDLSPSDMREIVARRVLRKKDSQESLLRDLFRIHGAALNRHVKLERSSRRTEFNEDEFVQLYPYLPHLIDLSVDAVAGIGRHPDTPEHAVETNRSIVKQSFEMVASDMTRLADRPVGALVSVDKIYDVVERNIPARKRQDVHDICQRFDSDEDYPRMAARLAKAICLMEFAQTDLPRTTRNIAALLIQRVDESPNTDAVAGMLHRLKEAGFVRETGDGWKLGDSAELRRAAAALSSLEKAVGAINPRLPGWGNGLIQGAKRSLGRVLAWYTRPMQDFNASVARSLQEIVSSLDRLSADMAAQFSSTMSALDDLSSNAGALETRVAQLKKRNVESMREIGRLREQVHALAGLPKIANRELPAGLVNGDSRHGPAANSRFDIDADAEGQRTAYIIGLFGTGRHYINQLVLQNLGKRAAYFRDLIRLHPGPTPMIYSGHATIKHPSRAQRSPEVMKGILEAVEAGYADLIFIYRHPLDSLLTNWVWWRTFIRDNRAVSGVSQIYKSTDDLCADLERNFSEFESFAAGDPDFFTSSPGPPFLSFPQFVEETELHLKSSPLSLRLEDFAVDPLKEFSKIVELMSLDADPKRLSLAPPVAKPYGYLAVAKNAPRFRDFIAGLDVETARRIEKIGYRLAD